MAGQKRRRIELEYRSSSKSCVIADRKISEDGGKSIAEIWELLEGDAIRNCSL